MDGRRYIKPMRRLLIPAAAIGLALLYSTHCSAEETLGPDPFQMSREEWQAHVSALRQQAETMRHERKAFTPLLPTPDEIAEQASRRILDDGSLQPGDIVSTNRGLFRFQGSADGERKPDDFVPVR